MCLCPLSIFAQSNSSGMNKYLFSDLHSSSSSSGGDSSSSSVSCINSVIVIYLYALFYCHICT